MVREVKRKISEDHCIPSKLLGAKSMWFLHNETTLRVKLCLLTVYKKCTQLPKNEMSFCEIVFYLSQERLAMLAQMVSGEAVIKCHSSTAN